MRRVDQFDREYCHAVKSACLRAIANTSYADDLGPTIPANEINLALVEIMGAIAATVEESLPSDLKGWAEELADRFAESFQATRASLTADDLDVLHGRH